MTCHVMRPVVINHAFKPRNENSSSPAIVVPSSNNDAAGNIAFHNATNFPYHYAASLLLMEQRQKSVKEIRYGNKSCLLRHVRTS